MFITLTRIKSGECVPTTIAVEHICMYYEQKDDGLIEHTSRKKYPDLPEVRTVLGLTYTSIEVLEKPDEIKTRINMVRNRRDARLKRLLSLQ